MHIVSRPKLMRFWEKHKDAEIPLRVWFKKVEQAKWRSINDLRKDFPSADYLGDYRVVFDIKGNRYRIIVLVFFDGQKVYLRFVGTHAEYDKINARIV